VIVQEEEDKREEERKREERRKEEEWVRREYEGKMKRYFGKLTSRCEEEAIMLFKKG